MSIPVSDPGIRVYLYKTIGRQNIAGQLAASTRFTGVNRVLNLTPYIGENGGVRITKSVRQPSGQFRISFADRMVPELEDSLYGFIEPMDIIEIRFARDPWKYVNAGIKGGLPIIMRGFVDRVMRGTAMSPDGHPVRSVTIDGRDYGKIWEIMQIFYLPNYVLGQDLLSQFKLFVNYGPNAKPNVRGSAFLQEVIDKIINPFINQIASESGLGSDDNGPMAFVRNIETLLDSVPEGVVSPFGANNFQGGTTYELLRKFLDVGPFNELFIEDREDNDGGITCVYRPTPFRTVDDKWIQDQGDPPEFISVEDSDITDISVMRGDDNVANYYWVDAPRYALNNSAIAQMMSAQGQSDSFYIPDYQNSTPFLYGMRKMEVVGEQGPNSEESRIDGQDKATRDQESGDAISWMTKRRRILIDQNKDNVVLEHGSIAMKGREDVRAGRYLTIGQGGVSWDCYVPSVTHDFVPFRSFTTVVQIERGNGFVKRVRRGGGTQSTYLNETNQGGVYG